MCDARRGESETRNAKRFFFWKRRRELLRSHYLKRRVAPPVTCGPTSCAPGVLGPPAGTTGKESRVMDSWDWMAKQNGTNFIGSQLACEAPLLLTANLNPQLIESYLLH